MYSLVCLAVQESQQTSWHGSAWKTQPPLAACRYLTHPVLPWCKSALPLPLNSAAARGWKCGETGYEAIRRCLWGKHRPAKLRHSTHFHTKVISAADYTVAQTTRWAAPSLIARSPHDPEKTKQKTQTSQKDEHGSPVLSIFFASLILYLSIYLSLSLSHSISMYFPYQSITLLNSISL